MDRRDLALRHMQIRGLTRLLGGVLLCSIVCACSRDKEITLNETALLERIAQIQPSDKLFVSDVRNFYQALLKRDWEYTYEARTNNFKNSVSLKVYLESAHSLSDQELDFKYEVLAQDEFVILGQRYKRLIMKFRINSVHDQYSVVWWAYEEGQWHCEEVGLKGTAFFNSVGKPQGVGLGY